MDFEFLNRDEQEIILKDWCIELTTEIINRFKPGMIITYGGNDYIIFENDIEYMKGILRDKKLTQLGI